MKINFRLKESRSNRWESKNEGVEFTKAQLSKLVEKKLKMPFSIMHL